MPKIGSIKRCSKCGETKPLAAFYRDRTRLDGRRSRCKVCFSAYYAKWREANRESLAAYREANRDRILAQKAEWRAANREHIAAKKAEYRVKNRDRIAAYDAERRDRARDQWLQREYGLTTEQYDAMVAAAEGVCEICHQPPPADNKVAGNRVLHVDHDHATGEVRGVLCHACNKSLGQIGDAHLAVAVAYVEADHDWRGMSPEPAPIPRVINGKRNPVNERDRRLRRKYGIDLVRYGEMLAAQNGRCAICEDEPRGDSHQVLCVDHDHRTGRVRGLLCASCNRSIGLIGDANLMAAARYLERTSTRVDAEAAA